MSQPRDLMGGGMVAVLSIGMVVAVILATHGGDPTVPTAADSGPFNQPIVTYSPEASS